MTNVFDFLRRLLEDSRADQDNQVTLTAADRVWIESFLRDSDDFLHFRARATGVYDAHGDPIVEQHLALGGDEFSVFSLMCEAALRNKRFARMVEATHNYMQDHVATCPDCQRTLSEVNMAVPAPETWEFLPSIH
jgi:hypothetical protein